MPIFDTLAQAAAATGVPVSALKMAKASGCRAFKHGRVDFGEFIRWFFARGGQDTNWKLENDRLDAVIKRIKLDELKRRVIDFGAVNRFLQELVGQAFFGELERMAQEFPPALKGRDEIDIANYVKGDTEKVKQDLTAKISVWAPKVGGMSKEEPE